MILTVSQFRENLPSIELKVNEVTLNFSSTWNGVHRPKNLFLRQINESLNAEYEIGQFCTHMYSYKMMMKIIYGSYVSLALGDL